VLRFITSADIAPQAIVFDMDGVLLDSSPIHAAAYREALSALPLREFHYARVAGMRSLDGIRTVLAENGVRATGEQIAVLASEKSRIALTRILAENPIVPGAAAVLRNLRKSSKLALATSASRASVNAFLDGNGLRDVFDCVVDSTDVQNSKPAPDIFALAIRRLGKAPAASLVVEDAVAGIQATKAAGAWACGICSTSTSHELERAGADLIIDRLEELLEVGARR
jgi:HAD superfamily hydrolase (TIGR01509 family)